MSTEKVNRFEGVLESFDEEVCYGQLSLVSERGRDTMVRLYETGPLTAGPPCALVGTLQWSP